jgi:hypothetical protein
MVLTGIVLICHEVGDPGFRHASHFSEFATASFLEPDNKEELAFVWRDDCAAEGWLSGFVGPPDFLLDWPETKQFRVGGVCDCESVTVCAERERAGARGPDPAIKEVDALPRRVVPAAEGPESEVIGLHGIRIDELPRKAVGTGKEAVVAERRRATSFREEEAAITERTDIVIVG